MIQTEKQLWQKLNTAFADSLASAIILTRIETGTTKKGVSDLCYTDGKVNGWIELKTPRYLNKFLNISPLQLIWAKYHPNSFFLICYNNVLLLLDYAIVVQLLKVQGIKRIPFYKKVFTKYGIALPAKNQSSVIRDYLTPFLTLNKTLEPIF